MTPVGEVPARCAPPLGPDGPGPRGLPPFPGECDELPDATACDAADRIERRLLRARWRDEGITTGRARTSRAA